MIAATFAYWRYVVGGIGIALGCYYLFGGNAPLALHIVSLTTVGIVGLLGFASHVLFGEGNAKRIGWESVSGFQLEVGFANLALALVALLAFFGNWGVAADAALVLAFGLYFVQAGLLFLWQDATDKNKHGKNTLRIVMFFLLGGWMLIFAISGMAAARIVPF
jgi:hypothetical protein